VVVDFDGDEEHYLLGNPEERREGYTTVSPESPMGAALMGKTAGDTVEWSVGANQFSAKVLRVSV
jgi:transcription elongation GreA/GreB family factor